ncbi:MAG: ATP-binding cassette domain-containing protein [Candidatus Cloacimonadota bacterium]|nr:MAG: ATP-binding cassette domain-containing protein [Candidatus Cloacimonadota bacterium]
MVDAIRVTSLSKNFGAIRAVDGIDFEVRKGELFGFLGPNGAGKTTTQRMLTGILKPDDGTIHIMGFDLLKNPFPAKILMGIVPEMSNAYIDLSAWENLMLMGQLYGVPKKKREKKGLELLSLLGLQKRKNEKTRGFSKGMKQRLILAMALLHEPELLFLDEPTVGLDVQSTRLIKNLIRELNENGVTVFLTTHNIEEANEMCTRVAIINKGRIVAIDKPLNLRNCIQSSQSVEVTFDKTIDDLGLLMEIDDVNDVIKKGDKLKLYTGKPGKVACRVVEYAKVNRLRVLTLNTLGPSLEDVFVHLTDTSDR